MIHLTYTGYDAGRLLCEQPREANGEYVHAQYAPIHNPEYRAKVCPHCLKVWANYAYDADDEMPDYIRELRG